MSKFIELPQLEIRKPCHENWAEMTGAEQSRHCAVCEKSVFNLSEMIRAEVQSVIQSGDSVCVRMQKRPDGSIVTKNSRGVLSRASAVVVSVLASLTLAGCSRDVSPTNTSPVSANGESVVPGIMGEVEMGDIVIVPPENESEDVKEQLLTVMGEIKAPPVTDSE